MHGGGGGGRERESGTSAMRTRERESGRRGWIGGRRGVMVEATPQCTMVHNDFQEGNGDNCW
jgi:hypothetical protein